MKTILYFCCKFLFFAVAILSSCTDIIEIDRSKDIIGGNGKGLSVSEARDFFEKTMMVQSRAEEQPKSDRYYAGRCMLPVGDFVPQWDGGISTDAPTLFSVDVPIKSVYKYRVLRIDDKTHKVYATSCYHELVVVRDLEGRMGCRIVVFIPDREYSIKNPGDVSRWLTNGIDMGDYSGLKIYTDLEGKMTRVNRFLNGKKIIGIDLTAPGTLEERLVLYVRALKTIGKISVQRQGTHIMTRGEDDWYDDSWDDWGSFWEDDYENEPDFDSDPFERKDIMPGEDIYYNHNDGNYYIDFDRDGKVDSCISEEVIITPDDDQTTSSGQSTPQEDPIEDPLDIYEWGDSTDNSDIIDHGSGDNGNDENTNQPFESVSLSYSVSSYPGYDKLKNCKKVADAIMRTILGSGKNIGSSANVVQLYTQKAEGKLDLVGDPENIFKIICNHLKNEHPITVGVDKNGKFYKYNNDATTEHFIVISGVDYDKIKGLYYFKYIETGRNLSSADEAISDENKIYYNPGNPNKALEGTNWKNDKYIIVQLRPNL